MTSKLTSSDDPDSDLEAALQSLPTPLTLAATDRPDMPIVAANAAFLKVCGHARDEVVGRNCRFLQGDLENDGARAEIRHTIEHRRRTQVILRNRRADGSEFWNYLTIIPMSARPGETGRMYLGAQFEMTEREVADIRGTGSAPTEGTVTRLLDHRRALMLERRRLSIDAASRLVQSHLILRSLSS